MPEHTTIQSGTPQPDPPPAAARREVDVAVVAFRSAGTIERCLSSLPASLEGGELHVVVVDNASDDGTVELVRSGFPAVELVASGRNLGFAAATNLAVRRGSHPFVLAVNPDVVLPPRALDRLLDVLDARPDVGVVGPRLVREDGSLDHAGSRSFPTVAGALGHFTGLARVQGAPGRLAQYASREADAGPVDAVNGAFMLMRRRAVEDAGLFDEGFWMYMEDLDLCYRLRAEGWLTWYEPSVTAVHTKWVSSGRYRSFALNRAFHYGMFRFYRKHYAGTRPWLVNAAVYAGIGVKLVVSACRSALARAGRP